MPQEKSVLAITLGCKLNYAETSSILETFVRKGWRIAAEADDPDLVIVHTCAVTGQAGQKSRQQIRKMMKKYPASRIAVVGCYAQLEADRVESMEGVDVILGSREKFFMDNYMRGNDDEGFFRAVSSVWVPGEQAFPARSPLLGNVRGRTRAFLKIQDGCDYGCAYCAIPFARGRSRSVDPGTVLREASALAAAGYREIVLTGVNIADYRHGGETISDLLQALDAAVDVARIRISSVEPDRCDDRLLRTVASSPKIMPHFHLPLQGGTDEILRAMRRRYTTAQYREMFLRAVELVPDCAIGADVMTGYPGESEKDFQTMYDLLESLPIAYLHVFPCSVRPGTELARQVARGSRRRVPPDVVRRRSRRLHDLGEKKKEAFVGRFAFGTLQVLFEEISREEDGNERYSGYSRNYIRVGVPAEAVRDGRECLGEVKTVRIESVASDLNLEGRIVT